MCNSDRTLVTDISSICSSWVDFYSALFTAEALDDSVQDQLLANLSARLSPEDSAKCEGPLSLDEVFKALEGVGRQISGFRWSSERILLGLLAHCWLRSR